MKFTFFSLHIKVIIEKALQYLVNMVFVGSKIRGINQNVVKVHIYKFVKKIT